MRPLPGLAAASGPAGLRDLAASSTVINPPTRRAASAYVSIASTSSRVGIDRAAPDRVTLIAAAACA